MISFAFTQTDIVVGTLSNGLKLVETIIKITSGDTGWNEITISPINHIIGYTSGATSLGDPGCTGKIRWTTIDALNGLRGTSNGDSSDKQEIHLMVFGY